MNEENERFYKNSTKRITEERVKKSIAKHRSREEQKRLKEKQKLRKALLPKKNRTRARDWEEEEDAPYEKMVASRHLVPSPGGGGGAAEPGPQAEPGAPPELRALVLAVERGRVRLSLGGRELEAELPEHLSRSQQTSVAVGDEVACERRDGAPPRVAFVLPRRSVLSRPDPGNAHRERVIAANVDVAAIVLSAQAVKPGLVDRYLIAVERGGVRPLLCLNKMDLASEDERRGAAEILDTYAALRVPGVRVSAETGEGLDELSAELAGCTCVFVGHSGVGKSTLLNALDPDAARATAAVRGKDGKGRHTTSSSTLHELADGTRVIDTPGVRAFGLWRIERAELQDYFPDFGVAEACRFSDCSHLVEPGCGVRAAVERGAVARSRYETYARIHASLG